MLNFGEKMDFMKNSVLVLCLLFLIGCLRFGAGQYDLSAFDLSKTSIDKDTHAVVILGGGVGGLMAATYLSQANIETLLLEGEEPGGAIAQSDSVRNWPGEVDIHGKKIAEKMREQALKSGAQIIKGKVVGINFSKWPYIINIEEIINGQIKTLKAFSCVIAMGATPNFLHIPGEKEYWGKGITNCATCDGPLYKDRVVAIVGAGDSAITEANYLSKIAKKVFILVRKNKFKATGKQVSEILKKNNVEVLYNTSVKEVVGRENKVTHLVIEQNNQINNLQIDGLFLAIGSTPNTTMFKDQLELDNYGYIVLKNNQETSKTGIYALGDISDYKFKQAVTAVGDGCKAALQTQDFLEKINFDPNILNNKQEIAPSEKIMDGKKEQTNTVISIKNSTEFEKEVLNSEMPVVVDFYADWCFPCKRMAPIFENIAIEFANKIKFAKVNVTNNNDLARKMEIQSVPTFLFIKNGKVVKKVLGAKDFDSFRKTVAESF